MRNLRSLPLVALGAMAAGLSRLLPAQTPAEGPLPPAAHEESDVGFRPMLISGLLLLLGLGLVMGLALWMYPASLQDQALQHPLPTFPEPQLQPAPPIDMAAFHTRQLRQLDTAYWTDRAAGRLHIPVRRAMEDVARQGIPDWPSNKPGR